MLEDRVTNRKMGILKCFWNGVGPSGFGSSSTAEEVTRGIDATNLIAIVTGATNGIGLETARVLAMRGATVIIPCRRKDAGLKIKETLLQQLPKAKLDIMEMDLSSFKSIESFVRSFDMSYKHLNILINNAGILACPYQLSPDGIELQFATNHLGHFLLTKLLLEKMKATTRETGVQGRIVNVSSLAHISSDTTWLDLHAINVQSKNEAYTVYCRTKLANILHANELSKRLQEEGANITANSLHPGMIHSTNITNYLRFKYVIAFIWNKLAKPFLKNIPQGAATTCYVALHPNLNDVTGKYFVDCNEAAPAPFARNENLAKRLWELSDELLEKKIYSANDLKSSHLRMY